MLKVLRRIEPGIHPELEIGRFLESGDTIELHVDKIGVLRNKVVRQDGA